MQYTLWIVSPYQHSKCFSECAQSLQSALIELGHNAEITVTPPITRENVIILGAHLLHPNDMLYLKAPIVWQLEQMPDESDEERARAPWTATYLEILRRAEVWDYSRVNIATLNNLGIGAKLLEVGYAKTLTRIENFVVYREYPMSITPIDVLHIGSLNDRRSHILKGLADAGVSVVHAFDCYGVKRDALVSRSKIIINIHFFQSKLFEVVRCSYLLSNRKAIVSEVGLDKQLEEPYAQAVCFDAYDRLVDRCIELLADDAKRRALAEEGFEIMRGRSQVEYLRKVL